MPPKSNKQQEIDSIAQATLLLLEPKFDTLETLISDCARSVDLNKAKTNILVNHYKIDGSEQYQKRENVRIGNFSPTGDVTDAVVALLNHMVELSERKPSVDSQSQSLLVNVSNADTSSVANSLESGAQQRKVFTRQDISDCPFRSPRPGKKRQVIVRFVSRQSVRTIYRCKRYLRESQIPEYKVVFLTDDVTPLRLRLKNVVGKIPGVERAYMRDGNVHCDFKGKHYKIMSPDDIFNQLKIDVTDSMMRELGLENFL
jgi:hypothetical protein